MKRGDYFHSQIKVVANINNGVSLSRTSDKFLGIKLVFLSVIIILFWYWISNYNNYLLLNYACQQAH